MAAVAADAAAVIANDAGRAFDGLVARLAAKAKALAEARLQARSVAPPLRWRRAGLLWPTFGGD